jgi:Fe-S-cluster containining protein
MISTPAATGSTTNRYRLPGIEREGIAQLSLLETALWPLQGGKLFTPRHQTTYKFKTRTGLQTAQVTVRSAMGLQSVDDYVLWGLLGSTLSRPDAEPLLLATPYWMLGQLGRPWRVRHRSARGPGRQPCMFLGNDNLCQVYPTRPNACVGMQAGDKQCQAAREEAGLPPLDPT